MNVTGRPKIEKCSAREILDSRGNPTVEAVVYLEDGSIGIASAPSGASTGQFEAHEKRDGNRSRYRGKGVLETVSIVQSEISPALSGLCASDQYLIDRTLRNLDGSENKNHYGANVLLALSLANARAVASYYHIPLYRYLGGASARRLPIPMMNVLNGGAHASNNVEIQEFMLVPVGAESFSDALRIGSEIYQTLRGILQSRGYSTAVGDEGGFAPNLSSDEEALDLLCEAIHEAGYDESVVKLALDAAASEWCDGGETYRMPKRGKICDRHDLIEYWKRLCGCYPILSIEDGLDENDFSGWSMLTEALGDRTMLVGDDLFVTNTARIRTGIEKNAANAVLVKPNQIGTLSETLDLIQTAEDHHYAFILSHRSGETEDTSIADIAVSCNARFIKAGAPCRGERVCKYNRLLRIEGALGAAAEYGGHAASMSESAALSTTVEN